MGFTNRISQTLHEEHRATVALMERLEQFIAHNRRSIPSTVGGSDTARLLAELATGVEAEVDRHFTFEEIHLFPFLNAIGDQAIGAHLSGEHNAMRPLGMRIAALSRMAGTNGFDEAGWDEFRRLGMELCERMLSHVQKEEMALLPLLEEIMDAETEARLYRDYVEKI